MNCPRCEVEDYGTKKRVDRLTHKPTTDEPSMDELQDWLIMDGDCEATDGCVVEPDGRCGHGHPSWPLVLGLI
jgi:hypothetical protein